MKIKSLIACSILCLLFASSASARAGSFGDAGCGPGSEIFKKNSIISQSLAVSVNTSFSIFLNTSAGVATSNCPKIKSFVKIESPEQEKQVNFVVRNYESLVVELAQGQGERLDTLAQTYGCEQESMTRFRTTLRDFYPNDTDVERVGAGAQLWQRTTQKLKNDPVLAHSCRLVI